MLKLGIVDFDTSHCVEFSRRLNHTGGIAAEQCIEGAKIILGCPGTSKVSPERIPGYAKTLAEEGVKLVDNPEDMIGKVDGVFIESNDGNVHLDRARPFLE